MKHFLLFASLLLSAPVWAQSGPSAQLTWTASTDDVGVKDYRIERCSGAGCSNYVQVGTSTTASYTDSGLSISTSYSWRVKATDAAGNMSPYSNIATGTTAGDTKPPTAPSTLIVSITDPTAAAKVKKK